MGVTVITADSTDSWSNLIMNTKRLLAGLAAACVALGSAAVADEIYKWTDADGNVHYGDRPTGGENEERMQISYSRTNKTSVQNRVNAHREAENARADARATAADEQEAAAQEAAEAEERAKRCEDYRGKLETMVQSRRIYREDEDGERVYLSDDEREAARTQAEKLIDENCN